MSDSVGGTTPSPLKKKGKKTWVIAAIVVVVVVVMIAAVVLGGLTKGSTEKYGLEKIKEQGKIVMWTEASFPPFESFDPTNSSIYGFDIDLANKIAENVSKELNMTITLQVEDRVFANIPTALNNNQIDMSLSGMTITDERNKSVLFSEPYYKAEAGYGLLTQSTASGMSNIDEILANGKKIVVNTGTTSESWVTENLVDTGKVSSDKVKSLPKISDCVQDVKSGYSDVFIIDNPTVNDVVSKSNGELKNSGLIPLPDEPYGVAMNHKSTDLKALVDRVIDEMMANGEMAALRAKWGL
ncbi:MAG: ABC transporter substrate-binding protein [Methanomassiliicoccus sp.]|nr:ABC transporter substrate-binding protein [Methanomassiliicoccus sp.]